MFDDFTPDQILEVWCVGDDIIAFKLGRKGYALADVVDKQTRFGLEGPWPQVGSDEFQRELKEACLDAENVIRYR